MDANEALTPGTLLSALRTMPRGYTGNDLRRKLRFASRHVDKREPLADIDLAASPHSGERVRICEDPA